MHFALLTFATLLPLALTQGGPGDPDFYSTVGEVYSGAGCDASSLVWPDPIFGRGGICQPLDRNDNTPDILSYKVVRQYPECTATLYTDDGCLSTAYPAPLEQCVDAPDGKPFVMAFVECPF